MGKWTRRSVLQAGGLVAGGAAVLGGGVVLADGENGPRPRPESALVTAVTEDINDSEYTAVETTTTETTTAEHTEPRGGSDSPGVTVVGVEQRGDDSGTESVKAAEPSPLLDDPGESDRGLHDSERVDPMNFDLNEWDLLHRNRSSGTDSHGNETGWTIEWRRDPKDATRQGIAVEMSMISGGYENDEAQITLDFDSERTNLDRHLPGNAEVPGLDIDDKTKWFEETVIQVYDIGNRLEDDTVRLAAAATTTTEPKPGATFVDVDVRSFYTDSLLDTLVTDRSEISNYYQYSWT